MEINFTDKNGRVVTFRVDDEEQAEIVLHLLTLVPDSEFIIKPYK